MACWGFSIGEFGRSQFSEALPSARNFFNASPPRFKVQFERAILDRFPVEGIHHIELFLYRHFAKIFLPIIR